jgi:hypothetical protein
VLYRLGVTTGADTALTIAWLVMPLIVIAEGFSWYAVLTTNPRGSAIENSIWAVTFLAIGIGLACLLPDLGGAARVFIAFAIVGIAGYLAFLVTVDVPMYSRDGAPSMPTAAGCSRRSKAFATRARAGS